MRHRALAVVLSLVAVAAFAAGCGSDKKEARPPLWLPAADSFKAGTCRAAAEPILALGEFAYRHDAAKRLTDDDREQLRTSSDTLHAAAGAAAEPGLAGKVGEVQAAVGFMRLRTGRSYEPKLLRDMETARLALQSECVSR